MYGVNRVAFTPSILHSTQYTSSPPPVDAALGTARAPSDWELATMAASPLDLLKRYLQDIHAVIGASASSATSAADSKSLAIDIVHVVQGSLSVEQLALGTAYLFDRSTGIIRFLGVTADKKQYDDAKVILLNFLAELVAQNREIVKEHGPDIKNICWTLFTVAASAKVKRASFEPLILVFEKAARTVDSSWQIDAFFKRYWDSFMSRSTKLSVTVKSPLFLLLGLVVRRFPDEISQDSKRVLLMRLVTIAQAELGKSAGSELELITGSLKGITACLEVMKDSVVQGTGDRAVATEQGRAIFQILLMVLNPPKLQTRFEAVRAGLQLLAERADLFRNQLYDQYQKVYTLVTELCDHKNGEVKKLALRAVESFLKEIAQALMDREPGKKEQICFKAFMKEFFEVLRSDQPDTKRLSIAIRGCGYFAGPCVKLGQNGLQQLHYLATQLGTKCSCLYSDFNPELEALLEHTSSFIKAHAYIALELPFLPDAFVDTLENVVKLMVMHFPRLGMYQRVANSLSFLELVWALNKKGGILKTFTNRIFFYALAICCSDAAIASDDRFARAAEDISQSSKHDYTDYLVFWETLFKEPFGIPMINDAPAEDKDNFFATLYDEQLGAVVRLCNVFDLTVVESQPVEGGVVLPIGAEQPSAGAFSSNEAAALCPRVPKDFVLFQNLVDFFVRLQPMIRPELFRRWAYRVFESLIMLSTRHPLVSGFYKMLGGCLDICRTIDYFGGIRKVGSNFASYEGLYESVVEGIPKDRRNTFILVAKFLREILVRMQQFKDDLLVACLRLVLSAPKELVHVPDLIEPVRTALRLGLSHLPLAVVALDALETWIREMSGAVRPYYGEILPPLNEYLFVDDDTTDEAGEMPSLSKKRIGTKFTTGSQRRGHAALRKNYVLGLLEKITPEGVALHDVCFRILKLLGSMGGENKLILQDETALLQQALAWDPERRIKFELPFVELDAEIYLDELMPKIVDLAESSPDRKLKVAACELLHAVMLLMTGNSANRARDVAERESSYHKIFRKVYPTLFQLATDVDKVTRDLFRQLLRQLVHWQTRSAQYENPDTVVLLECAIDAACDRSGSLRDWGAECVAEFVNYSIKQSSDQSGRNNVHTKSLLKRIYVLCLHANSDKRLGASLMLNRIYRIVREQEDLVNQFTFEILYHALSNLRLSEDDNLNIGTRQQAKDAVLHMQRIINKKADLFLAATTDRRMFKGLEKADLAGLVDWLFRQAGKIEETYAKMCMALFDNFVAHLPQKTNAAWVKARVRADARLLSTIFEPVDLKNFPDASPVLSTAVNWIRRLMSTLWVYKWLVSTEAVTPAELLTASGSSFVDGITNIAVNIGFADARDVALTAAERVQHGILKGRVAVSAFGLLATLLQAAKAKAELGEFASHLKETGIWTEQMVDLMGQCLLNFQGLGLQFRAPEEYEVLRAVIGQCIRLLNESNQKRIIRALMQRVVDIVFSDNLDLAQLDVKKFDVDPITCRYTVEGLAELRRARVYEMLFDVASTWQNRQRAYHDELLGKITQMIRSAQRTWNDLGSTLLQHVLEVDSGLEDHLLGNILGLNRAFPSYSDASLTYRKLFDAINSYAVTHFRSLHQKLQAGIAEPIAIDFVQGTFEYLLENRHLTEQRRIFINDFSSTPSFFRHLAREWDKIMKRDSLRKLVQMIMRIDPLVLDNCRSPEFSETLIQTFLSFLDRNVAFGEKVDALDMLPPFLLHQGPHTQQIERSIHNMIVSHFPASSTDVGRGTSSYNHFISALDKLLNAMVRTGSQFIFENVVVLQIYEKDHVHKVAIERSVRDFVLRLSLPRFIATVDFVYGLLERPEHRADAYFNIYQLLILCLVAVPHHMTAQFFISHISELLGTVKAVIPSFGTDEQIRTRCMRKAGSFELISAMYQKLPTTLINEMPDDTNKSLSIVAAFCESPKTGKELNAAVVDASRKTVFEPPNENESEALAVTKLYMRQTAYNAFATAVACTQKNEMVVSKFLFKENEAKKEIIYERIIDTKHVYMFAEELDKPLIRVKLAKFRAASGLFGRRRAPDIRYLSSQYLVDSSLSQSGMFSEESGRIPEVLSESDQGNGASSLAEVAIRDVDIEVDEINSNPCMKAILSVIAQLYEMDNGRVEDPLLDRENAKRRLPEWMAPMFRRFTARDTSINVQLFIAKCIINNPKPFFRFAGVWLAPLMQLAASGESYGGGFNYMVQDICALLAVWGETYKLEASDREIAFRFMSYLMRQTKPRKAALRNQLEIVKAIYENWKEHVVTPTYEIFLKFSNVDKNAPVNLPGIQLVGVVLANDVDPYYDGPEVSLVELSKEKFYSTLVDNLKHDRKEIHESAAEVCGMALAYMRKHNSMFQPFETKVTSLLITFTKERSVRSDRDRFLQCLHKIQRHDAAIISEYFLKQIFFRMPTLHGALKTYALEIIATTAKDAPDIYPNIRPSLALVLRHRDERSQLAMLSIILAIVNRLQVAEIEEFIPVLVENFSSHPNIECKLTYYRILVQLLSSLPKGETLLLRRVRVALLQGVTDSSDAVCNAVMSFLNNEEKLSPTPFARLEQLLNTYYAPEIEEHFVHYATYLLLDATKHAQNYDRPLFAEPLPQALFEREPFQIDTSWQHSTAMTPLFVATPMPSQSAGTMLPEGQIRATQQALEFSLTQEPGAVGPSTLSIPSSLMFSMATASTLGTYVDREHEPFQPIRTKESKYARLRRRFLKEEISESQGAYFATQEERRKRRVLMQIKTQQEAKAKRVTMLRTYRIGELPDIQIKRSEILLPLQALANGNVDIARLLFKSTFLGIFLNADRFREFNEEAASAYRQRIGNNLSSILSSSTALNPAFTNALFGILHQLEDIDFDAKQIAPMSESSSNYQMGIVLLETRILHGVMPPPASKKVRGKRNDATRPVNDWMSLARLYRGTAQPEIFRSIYECHVAEKAETKDAISAEVRGDYETALKIITEALQSDMDASDTEIGIWERERLSCFEKLTRYDDLADSVITDLENDIGVVWDDDWRDPYLHLFLRSFLRLRDGRVDECNRLQEWTEDNPNPVFKFIADGLNHPERKAILESTYAQGVALSALLEDNLERSRYYTHRAFSHFLYIWRNLHPLARSSRLRHLGTLQQITESDEFLTSLKAPLFDKLVSLLSSWKNRFPSRTIDAIEDWDDVLFGRTVMLPKLQGFSPDLSELVEEVRYQTFRELAAAARVQGNFYVAEKYLSQLPNTSGSAQRDYAVLKLNLEKAKLLPMPAQLDVRFKVLGRSYHMKHQPLPDAEKTKILVLGSRVYESLIKSIAEDSSVFGLICENQTAVEVLGILHPPSVQSEARLLDFLVRTGHDDLEAAVSMLQDHEPENLSRVQIRWASFCDSQLRIIESDEKKLAIDTSMYASTVIENVALALRRNFVKAIDLFPRLLQLVDVYPKTWGRFEAAMQRLDETWMLIRWIPQMVALLDKPAGGVILPVLSRLAREWPCALYYPLRISSECYDRVEVDKHKMGKRIAVLAASCRIPVFDEFIRELSRLTDPEHVFKNWFDRTKSLLEGGNSTEKASLIASAYVEMSGLVLDKSDRVGKLAYQFAQKHGDRIRNACGRDGSKLANMSVKVFEAKLGDIAALRPGQGESGKLGKRAVARDLITSYSPWLAEFHAQDHDPLEIPGQYTGLAKPCPELHAKMATVDQRVLVMQSIRRPKRITITTTDEKEYRFLVKGGEDLRLDQRIQQLFTVMNSLMRRNGYCAAHNVVVATYKIVPMTSRLGIIEWVPDTSPFKSCVESQNRSMDNWNQAYKTFKRWIDRFGSSPYTAYPKMYNSNRQEVEKNFRSVQSYIPGNLLRNMLYKLAFGAEEFFTIRAQFVHSLAALSITSYILGIGDRHCDNFLVDLKSGRLIPIDFGHAFGSATEILPVPELMPFRLTRQFEGVLEPLGISGLLEPAMVNVLQAIRDGKDQVLNVMDVFCKEPLLDWKEHAIRQAKRQNAVRIETPDISSKLAEIAWYPQQKIVIARRKLEGENPAFITVEELANGHRNAPFFELLREIAMGDKKLNVRAQSPQHTASVRDQVLCLLDQATDPNILGRTYIGWMPW